VSVSAWGSVDGRERYFRRNESTNPEALKQTNNRVIHFSRFGYRKQVQSVHPCLSFPSDGNRSEDPCILTSLAAFAIPSSDEWQGLQAMKQLLLESFRIRIPAYTERQPYRPLRSTGKNDIHLLPLPNDFSAICWHGPKWHIQDTE